MIIETNIINVEDDDEEAGPEPVPFRQDYPLRSAQRLLYRFVLDQEDPARLREHAVRYLAETMTPREIRETFSLRSGGPSSQSKIAS